ncbi:MAG: effector-associated constant component EACC1 [Pseudonocardiaceae bacterium]
MQEFIFEFEGTTVEKDQLARDLVAWLNNDDELRGATRVRMAGPEHGELGGAADAVLILAAAAPMARPFFGWLTERAKSRRVSVRITKSDSGGESLRVELAGAGDSERLFRRVAEFIDQDSETS